MPAWEKILTPDFKDHLRRQLGFLQRSCESYDAGHTDESIRIATVIRVLVHDTKNSTSLLKHLRATSVKISSTVAANPKPNAVMLGSMGRLTIRGSPPASATWEASTSADSIRTQLPLSEWWNQIVFIFGKTRCSRKDLVLAAADKDGGAHIDAKLTEDYETLMTSGIRGFFHYSPTGETGTFKPIMDAHLVYIRQMGHEVLNSPELRALVDEKLNQRSLPMPTPEEQRQYTKLSAALQQLGHSFSRELPAATVSLHLHSVDGQPRLDAYDQAGKIIAILPTEQTPKPLRNAIEHLARENCPDPDGIVCPL